MKMRGWRGIRRLSLTHIWGIPDSSYKLIYSCLNFTLLNIYQSIFDKSPVTFAPSFASAPQDPELQTTGIYSLSATLHSWISLDRRLTPIYIISYKMWNFHITLIFYHPLHNAPYHLSEDFSIEVRRFPLRSWQRWNASCTDCLLNSFITASRICLVVDVFLTPLFITALRWRQ